METSWTLELLHTDSSSTKCSLAPSLPSPLCIWVKGRWIPQSTTTWPTPSLPCSAAACRSGLLPSSILLQWVTWGGCCKLYYMLHVNISIINMCMLARESNNENNMCIWIHIYEHVGLNIEKIDHIISNILRPTWDRQVQVCITRQMRLMRCRCAGATRKETNIWNQSEHNLYLSIHLCMYLSLLSIYWSIISALWWKSLGNLSTPKATALLEKGKRTHIIKNE